MRITLVGATGNVGREILTLLQERKFPYQSLRLYASPKSAGSFLHLSPTRPPYLIEDLNHATFHNTDAVLFATESEISKDFVPKALEAGCYVVDNSSLYRLEKNVPLIVGAVNSHCLQPYHRLVATPNCLASPLSVVLSPLQHLGDISQVVLTTFQSVSGAGKKGMDELKKQTLNILDDHSVEKTHFPHPIGFNLFPQVGSINDEGFCSEEEKIILETQKVLNATFSIFPTTVRVPVFVGHSISCFIEFKTGQNLNKLREAIKSSPAIHFQEDGYVTPREVENQNAVFVGRLRQDPTSKKRFSLWITSNNLRRGAALDVIEVLEILPFIPLKQVGS